MNAFCKKRYGKIVIGIKQCDIVRWSKFCVSEKITANN